MEPMLYRRPTLQQLERDVVNFNEKGKEMKKEHGTRYEATLEDLIRIERDNMMQAIFPSERMKHASRIAELEKQLRTCLMDHEAEKILNYEKQIALCRDKIGKYSKLEDGS